MLPLWAWPGTVAGASVGMSPTPWPSGREVDYQGAFSQIASSGIEIDNAFFGDGECVIFTNLDARTATNVQFVFSWYAASGKRLRDDLVDVQGAFHQGIRTAMPRRGQHGGESCFDNEFVSGAVGMSVLVTGVRYYDGSVWQAVPPVTGTTANSASGVSLASVRGYAGVRVVVIKDLAGKVPYEECADLTNKSSRAVNRVQVIFKHVGADGLLLGEERLDIRATIPPGATIPGNCEIFRGTVKPSIGHYARALATGHPDPAQPIILIDGHASLLSASVSEVDYADGTSWKAP